MSWKAAQTIRDLYRGKHKLMLLTMATYASEHGDRIYPSVKTLAEQCGITDRNARKHIADLMDSGVLVRTKQSTGGPQTNTNCYAINISALTPVATDTPVASDRNPCRHRQASPVATDSRKGIERVDERVEEETFFSGEQIEQPAEAKKPKQPDGFLKDGTDPIAGTSLETPEFREAWAEWFAYRQERKLPRWVDRTLLATVRKLEGWGERGAIEAIDASITAGWQGIFEPKAIGNRGKPAKQFVKPSDPTEQNWNENVRRY